MSMGTGCGASCTTRSGRSSTPICRTGRAPPRARCSSEARARCRATSKPASRSATAVVMPTTLRAGRAAKRSMKRWARRSTSLAARAEGRHVDADDVDAIEEVLAEALLRHLGARGRGWSRRRCARRTDTSASPPTGRTVRSWRTRRSFACIPAGISPISSRKSVPARRLHEEPRARRAGVGERALHVAEELALEQRSRASRRS